MHASNCPTSIPAAPARRPGRRLSAGLLALACAAWAGPRASAAVFVTNYTPSPSTVNEGSSLTLNLSTQANDGPPGGFYASGTASWGDGSSSSVTSGTAGPGGTSSASPAHTYYAVGSRTISFNGAASRTTGAASSRPAASTPPPASPS